MEEKISKERMLVVLDNWKLQTPKAEIKTMPEGLRKEVREFVKSYIGNYSSEIRNIRDIKKDGFLKKHREKLEKDISSDISIKNKLKIYDKNFNLLKKAYKLCSNDSRLSMNSTIYAFTDNDIDYKFKISSSYIADELDNKFDEIYGQGFKEFQELLRKFEQKIEEAILFGTITDVYKIIQKYSEFDKFSKKLSNLKIK